MKIGSKEFMESTKELLFQGVYYYNDTHFMAPKDVELQANKLSIMFRNGQKFTLRLEETDEGGTDNNELPAT